MCSIHHNVEMDERRLGRYKERLCGEETRKLPRSRDTTPCRCEGHKWTSLVLRVDDNTQHGAGVLSMIALPRVQRDTHCYTNSVIC